ncbi:RICIN domain-containing protein [Crossiella cryophila]|uniref:Ricin B lectin domain-containing protein n=1 Tax=Crossiella cryophila TaxID=43355 RepID=A0A7W7FY86_9PSEU|nr:RICIN domain-containing protein [Crossiella cryophila]MBB4681815.1 hypothetical protein [Crossiella cryophila]
MGSEKSPRNRVAMLLAGLPLLVVPGLASAAPAAPAGAQSTSILRNAHSGKCLEIGFSGTADFNVANQFACHSRNNQKWTIEPIGSEGYNLIKNVHSGKCLEIGFGGTADFNVANQWACHGGNYQRWIIRSATGGVTIRNQQSGKCLEIGFSGTADFNVANQFTCHTGNNQKWLFV